MIMKDESKVVFITGSSTGIGMETARYFFNQKWHVIATMRHPEKRKTVLHEQGLPDLVHLDVLDRSSIQFALKYALNKYAKIDVLVNNAGYALFGPFEAITQEQIMREFNTNVFGLMEVTRQFLPQFRKQKNGVIVNVASIAGRAAMPLYSLYVSTKWAVDGFSESLHYELKPLNIKVKIIEPGVISTDFYERSLDKADCSALGEDYAGIIKRSGKMTGNSAANLGSEPEEIARVIYQAATDNSKRLRYLAGKNARLVSSMRRILPEGTFYSMVEKSTLS
jgi:short-subunit dehydrogenase